MPLTLQASHAGSLLQTSTLQVFPEPFKELPAVLRQRRGFALHRRFRPNWKVSRARVICNDESAGQKHGKKCRTHRRALEMI
jgi:hypothetical protein